MENKSERDKKKAKKKKEMKLPLSFYRQNDVIDLGKKLLGNHLYTNIDNNLTGGIIVETESYNGIDDKASHAYGGRYTERTKTIYGMGGVTYIYQCYGIHYLLNVVTGKKEHPTAILIRAIEPIVGIDIMLKRRKKNNFTPELTAGPGALCQALGITKKINNIKLNGSIIWIESSLNSTENRIISSPRVGVSYAKEDALLPWRFRIAESKWTSKAK